MSKSAQRTTIAERKTNHNRKVRDQRVTITGQTKNESTIVKCKANAHKNERQAHFHRKTHYKLQSQEE